MENRNYAPYKKMAIMLIVSFFIMYLVMFLNVAKRSDIYMSLTRTYMALLMTAPMALLMLAVMRDMYSHKKLNLIIIIISFCVFTFALTALRSQAFISEQQYLKAMIPHHSSAILTSQNANLQDAEVRRLADSIIQSQQREIEQMKKILDRLH